MSNLLRTIQQVTRDYVDSISHRLPSIKNGTVTATSSDGTATVRVDGDTATTGSVPSIATVKTGDRVKMLLFNRQLTILGAIKRTDKLVADTIAGGIGGRNLALDSNLSTASNAYLVRSGLLSEPWEEGATYTVTIKGSVNTPNRLQLYRDNGWMPATALTEYDAERGVYISTFVCPPRHASAPEGDLYKFSIYNWPQATATSANIEWIKIERGSVATDWTRAPEDAEPNDLMRYLPGNPVGSPIGGFDANTVDRGKPSMIPIYNGVNTPLQSIAVLETIPYSPDWVAQYFHAMPAGNGVYHRTFHSGSAWSAWEHVGSATYYGNASNGAVRYSNGVQIAFLATTTNTAITTAYGPAFQTTYTWTFAAAFSSTPAVSCGRFQYGTSASWGMVAHSSDVNENTQALLRGMDFFSRPSGSTKISAIAVGRWR